MEINGLSHIEIIPEGGENQLFMQRETGISHTPYETETIFYSYLRAGNVEMVKENIGEFMKNGLIIGRLSTDNVRQMKYWAVCCVTLGIRYAIQGGLDETDAYILSDKYIQHIDSLSEPKEVVEYITAKAIELTEMVASSRAKSEYPEPVIQCINYIHKHLHDKLTVEYLASVCHLSSDYLSSLFKKNVGETLSNYILDQKLESSKAMLNGKYEYSAIGYYLGFSSESYFIHCFKKKYGITPKQYLKTLKF